jgi:hypothetical protein
LSAIIVGIILLKCLCNKLSSSSQSWGSESGDEE